MTRVLLRFFLVSIRMAIFFGTGFDSFFFSGLFQRNISYNFWNKNNVLRIDKILLEMFGIVTFVPIFSFMAFQFLGLLFWHRNFLQKFFFWSFPEEHFTFLLAWSILVLRSDNIISEMSKFNFVSKFFHL